MKRNAFIVIASALLAAPWAPAQEEPAKPRKPITKAEKESKESRAKLIQKRHEARAKAKKEAQAKAVDLNHASKDELKKLPGITDAMADAIIAKRPHKTKTDPVVKGIMPEGVYISLKSKIIVR